MRLLHSLTSNSSIIIQASDNGNVPRISEQNFTVYLNPTHQLWKFFIRPIYSFSISKEWKIGSSIHNFYMNCKFFYIEISILLAFNFDRLMLDKKFSAFERPHLQLISDKAGGIEPFNISVNGELQLSAVLTNDFYSLIGEFKNFSNKNLIYKT